MSAKKDKRVRSSTVETLEQRNLFASISLSGSTVSIFGDDNWHDSAVVSLQGNQVKIKVSSTPTNGFLLTPAVKEKLVPTSITKINFYGNSGNDSFINNWYNSSLLTYASGGSGDDYLEGYNGRDEFYGGIGNDTIKGYGGNDLIHGGSDDDTIYGGSGHDDLYGDGGEDTIFGDAGNDGLYGGAGTDKLYGGADSDRFLVMSGQSEHKDANSADAIIYFRNGSTTWSEEEIEDVDKGLGVLHRLTNNDNLLELKNGGALTFQREKANGSSSTLADNDSAGRIRMFDAVFASEGLTAITTVHEIAHNWDTEHSNWTNWQKISGWRTTEPSAADASKYNKSTDGTGWYLKTATFARSYGKWNAKEDFATSWESYFVYKLGMTNTLGVAKLSAAKTSHLDAFFTSLVNW